MAVRKGGSSKPVPRRRPEWDDFVDTLDTTHKKLKIVELINNTFIGKNTVSDLSVYRLSKDEIERRKRIHQSNNISVARQEWIEKQLQLQELNLPPPGLQKGPSRVLNPTLHTSTTSHRHAAVLREVFSSRNELQDVLAQSDHMLSQVKDMFGDDPQHYTGFPTLTAAPTGVPLKKRAECRATLQEAHNPSSVLYSPAGIRDDSLSIVSKPALNEMEDKENVDCNSVGSLEDRHSSMCESEGSQKEGSPSTSVLPSITTVHDSASLAGQSIVSGAGHIIEPIDPQRRTPHPSHSPAQRNTSDTISMDSLASVLESLEKEIMDYESATGREVAHLGLTSKSGVTVGGYTSILLSAVVRLTGYLRESYLQLQHEVTARNKLLESVSLQQSLLDKFSSDILEMQQLFHASMEDAKQQNALQAANLQSQISSLKDALSGNSRTEAIGVAVGGPIQHPVVGGSPQCTSESGAVIPMLFAGEENHKASFSSVRFDQGSSPRQATRTVSPVATES